ncbi:hypothetical protein [Actinospica robiniae]|uniref:hypothetical protein n=1 Tax=Actinospica robiniae TaxID=304901 RepID=UPI0012F7E9FF|nr:hypothetical protein [Actinospica robiniae]
MGSFAEGAFVSFHQPPRRRQAPATPSPEPWYRQTVYIVILLIFFFPVGLALLWMRPDWSVRRRGIVTAVIGVAVIIALASANPPPTTTTVLSPTAVGASPSSPSSSSLSHPSSSPTPPSAVSQQPATPSSVATTSLAPATTAPRKTTAPAVVPVHRTSAAPVHTTKAPAPVKTTAQKPSCHPLSSTNHCYKPGQFCSNADHGMSGIDEEGDPIKCVDNNGWRWEAE